MTAANPQTPAPVMIGIFSVELAEDAIVLGYDYETLPEITAADVTVKALTETKNTFDLTAAQLADAEFSFVNTTTQLPLRADEYDFTQYTTTSNVAIKVVLGDYEKVSNAITVTAPEVTVKYTGKGIVENEKLVADPSDFYVTVKEGTSYRQLTDLTADDFIFSKADDLGSFTEGTGYANAITEAPKKDGDLYAFVVYQGVESTISDSSAPENKITVLGEAAAEITDVTFTVDTSKWTAPAKQYYDSAKYATAVTAPASTAIKDFKVTMSKGEAGTEQAIDKFTFALYTAEGEAVPASVTEEYDGLANIDSILVGAYLTADKDKNDKVIYYSDPIKLATPEIKTLVAEYDPEEAGMVGDAVKVTIVAKNDNGPVNKDYKDYSVDYNNKPFTGNFSALTYGEDAVEYTVWMNADPTKTCKVNIPAGKGYYELTGEDVLVLKADAPKFTLVDANLKQSFATLYEISDAAFATRGTVEKGGQAPAIVAYSIPESRTVSEGNNSVTVTIAYLGKSGEVEKTTATVTIEGSAYVEDGATFSFTYNDKPITKLESGEPYNASHFKVVADAEHTHGNPQITIKGIKDKWNLSITGNFTADGNYAPYVFSFEYVNDSLETVKGADLKLDIATN